MNDELKRKFLDTLLDLSTKVNSDIQILAEDDSVRSRLVISDDFSFLDVDQSLVEYIVGRDDSALNLDEFRMRLEKARFFYTEGTREPSFKISSRYINAVAFINEVSDKIKQFCSTSTDNNEIQLLESRKRIVEGLLHGFNDGVYSGSLISLDSYDFIFEDREFNESEIASVYESLVKGYCTFLEEQMTTLRAQAIEIIDSQVEENQREIPDILRESISVDEPIDQEITSNNNNVLTEDQKQDFNKCKEVFDRYAEQLYTLSSKRLDAFRNFKLSLDLNNNDLETIKNGLNVSDYKLFLAYCAKKTMDDIAQFVDTVGHDPDLIQMLEMELQTCKTYCDELESLEIVDEEIDTQKNRTLVFYGCEESTTMFEKSIKDIPQEKYDGISHMLEQLSVGNLGNSKLMHGASSVKSIKFFEIQDGDSFVVYGLLPKNHIIVYSAYNISQMYKSRIDSKLSMIVPSNVKSIGDKINDESLGYRKLLSDNEKATTRINNTLGGNQK